MLTDAIDLLDRQVEFLNRQQGREFFWCVPSFIRGIQAEPRLGALLEDLLESASDSLASINSERARLRGEVVGLRDDLTAASLWAAESAVGAAPGAPGSGFSLADFDRMVEQESVAVEWPERRRGSEESDTLSSLLNVLRERIRVARASDEHVEVLTVCKERHDELRRHVQYVRKSFFLHRVSSGAAAAFRLVRLANDINPRPELQTLFQRAQDELRDYAEIPSFVQRVRRFVYDDDWNEVESSETELLEEARGDVALFHHEARRRLGLTRSMHHVMQRYAVRCMWHHAPRLRALAESDAVPERPLKSDCAAYLHDQGLNPVPEAVAANLRADILAPMPASGWTLYIEAKQYKKADRPYLVKGVRQVWDTLGKLRGTEHEVREAFYVVFRRGGPRYVFPQELRSEGTTVYPVLIDIADSSVSGSKQLHQPVALMEEELLPVKGAAVAAPPRGRGVTKRPNSGKKGR